MYRIAQWATLCIAIATPSLVRGADFAHANADLAAFDAAVKKMVDEFAAVPGNAADKAWVKKKLKHMFAVDQYMRTYTPPQQASYTKAEEEHYNTEFFQRWEKIDGQNTVDLKALLARYSWFTISEWGKATDNQAWLIAQHADHDPDFQREVLAKLEKLYPSGETQPGHYAYLYDRVATSWNDPAKRQLQRYGTQGQCVAPGKWEPYPIEDPENVDARRAAVGLPPLAEYMAGFKDLCK